MKSVEFNTKIDQIRSTIKKSNEMQNEVQNILERSQDEIGSLGIDLNIEDAKLKDVRAQEEAMTANIASLITDLDQVTQAFGAQFNEMRKKTAVEKVMSWIPLVGAQKSEEMRQSRITETDVDGQLNDLISTSNVITEILSNQKSVLEEQRNKSSESLKSVLSEREETVSELETIRVELNKTEPQLITLDEQIMNETDPGKRTALDTERAALAETHNKLINDEQVMTARSQELEKFKSMYQTFIDSLENQIATQSVLINKLQIDSEQRVVLYDALVKSMQTASQQEVAHQINTIGESVDREAEKTMAHIGAATNAQMVDMLEHHEKNMEFSSEIQKRKADADAMFNRRLGEVMRKHDRGEYGTN